MFSLSQSQTQSLTFVSSDRQSTSNIKTISNVVIIVTSLYLWKSYVFCGLNFQFNWLLENVCQNLTLRLRKITAYCQISFQLSTKWIARIFYNSFIKVKIWIQNILKYSEISNSANIRKTICDFLNRLCKRQNSVFKHESAKFGIDA